MEFNHILDAVKNCGGETPTMRAIAMAVDCAPTKLYSLGKKPVPGQVYDPSVTNWDAINAFLGTKIVEPEQDGFHSMEDIVNAAYEMEQVIKSQDGRRGTGTGNNLIEVDGEKIPARKSAKFEMGSEQESFICLKKDANVYKIVYQTMSHTILRPVNEAGEFVSNELRAVSNLTLNTKCIPPVRMDAAIQERFSGEYAAKIGAPAESAE